MFQTVFSGRVIFGERDWDTSRERRGRAWLYGKLLVALLGDKLIRLGRDISPWGYRLPEAWQWQRVAGF